MEVQEIYDVLKKRLVEIQLHKSIIKDLVKEELARLSEYINAAAESGAGPGSILAMQSMWFRTLKTGKLIRGGFVKTDAEGLAKRTAEHKNRQYGWLLVEAYEEYGDFLERIYAHIGKTDQNALTRLRQLYPDLESVEDSNIYKIHIRVAIALIRNLRHKIVHARGRIDDLENFNKCILKECELWNNGNPDQKLKDLIEHYVIEESDTYSVWLYERPVEKPQNFPFHVYEDTWNFLIKILISHAYAICAMVDPEFASDNQAK